MESKKQKLHTILKHNLHQQNFFAQKEEEEQLAETRYLNFYFNKPERLRSDSCELIG